MSSRKLIISLCLCLAAARALAADPEADPKKPTLTVPGPPQPAALPAAGAPAAVKPAPAAVKPTPAAADTAAAPKPALAAPSVRVEAGRAHLSLGGRSDRRILLLGSPGRVTLDAVVCSLPDGPVGVALEAPSTLVFAESSQADGSWNEVRLAASAEACSADEGQSVFLGRLAQNPWPHKSEGVTLWFDSGVAELTGPEQDRLQLLAVRQGLLVSSADCGAQPDCTLTLKNRFLSAIGVGDESVWFELWPTGLALEPAAPLPLVFDAAGREVLGPARAAALREVIFDRPLISGDRLDSSQDRMEIPVRKPSAIDRVSCEYAECRLTANGVLIFQTDPSAARVRMTYWLAPRHLRKVSGRLVSTEKVSLDLEPCRLRIPREIPLLAGTSSHRYFLKLPRSCSQAAAEDLMIRTRPVSTAYVRSDFGSEDGVRLLEVVIDRVPASIDRLNLVLFERQSVPRRLGSVRLPVAKQFAPTGVTLTVDDIGPVTFIPSNRAATLQLLLGAPSWRERLAVLDRAGFYKVEQKNGGWQIRGEPGASGAVPLRLVYLPSELGEFLGADNAAMLGDGLVAFDTEALFSVREINLPLNLLPGPGPEAERFIQVLCDDGASGQEIQVGRPARIAYDARDGCRIVFQMDRIPASYGTQRLRVEAGNFKHVLELVPNRGTLTVSIPAGDRSEYDTLLVVVAHDMHSGHYVLKTKQKLGEEARYRIILSDSSVRISATTALPTGMFRFGAGDAEGTVPLSAGALSRVTYVQSDGKDFPVGLEFGLFGTNLSGQPDFSMVAGIGLSIPVLNANTPLQASFNIHAWVELAPTRATRDEGLFAFLFGPSFTVGRLSTTF